MINIVDRYKKRAAFHHSKLESKNLSKNDRHFHSKLYKFYLKLIDKETRKNVKK